MIPSHVFDLQDKKEKKSKKDKKKSKDDSESGEKDYLKEAMFGKKEDDDLVDSDDDEDSASAASEAGVDDEGAMSKYTGRTGTPTETISLFSYSILRF